MDGVYPSGRYFRGFLKSSDISTAAAVPLFDGDGKSITLQKGQRLIINECLINNGDTASVITLFCDTNGNGNYDAGEELVAMNLAAKQPFSFPNSTGYIMGRISDGNLVNLLKAVASVASANTVIEVSGVIINS